MEEKPFYFSAIPYTPQELESALHREELPAPRRTVVSILGAMRGVGGIDSWDRMWNRLTMCRQMRILSMDL